MQISSKTSVYCVIGHPVVHSLSPPMHNRAFLSAGHDAVYVAFDTNDPAGAADSIRTLGIRGASVTIPHKADIMAQLDEIDENARSIGAVNTMVNRGGRLFGYNTDGQGAVRAVLEKTTLEDKTAVIVGAGGAARAIGHAFSRQGASLYITNRTEKNGRQLAEELNAGFAAMDELSGIPADILVNTTPVGMHPNTDAIPVPKSVFRPGMFVMDIVYNPLRTRLLAEAEACGCHVIDGVGMFVYQGAGQFSLWTGAEAPVAEMREIVYNFLNS